MSAPSDDLPVVGSELPPVQRVPTRDQVVRYAGASKDYSPIHYDDEAAHARGFETVVIHGQLKSAFLADMVEQWALAHGGWVQHFSAQYRRVDPPGAALTCRATVTSCDTDGSGRAVEFALRVENAGGQATTLGTARVVFDRG